MLKISTVNSGKIAICLADFNNSNKMIVFKDINCTLNNIHLLNNMRLKKFNLHYGAQLFKALSEEARIRILFLLYYNKELTISDLELILEFTQTKTARHLTYLKNSGIVSIRKRDQWVFYYLKEEAVDIITQIFHYLDKDQTIQNDQITYETLNSNRELAANKIEVKMWKS